MSAYYNEIDPWCCERLRRRIADGRLPPGDVDERDVRTVPAGDIAGYDQVHLFAGIGGFAYACRLAGWPDDESIWTGGFPCQPFSLVGARSGISDDRYLWPEIVRLLAAQKERPAALLFENVDGITDLALDRVLFDLEALGYAARPIWLPAGAVDAPHQRIRVWIPALDTVGQADGAGDRWGEKCPDAGRHAVGDQPEGGAAGFDAGGSHGDAVVGQADNGDGQFQESERGAEGRDGSRSVGEVAGESDAVAQGDGIEPRLEGHAGDGDRNSGREKPSRPVAAAGVTGAWSNWRWIPCADRKARRAPEPVFFALADGVSGGLAGLDPRLGSPVTAARFGDRKERLAAIGNAIVPQEAARILQAMRAA